MNLPSLLTFPVCSHTRRPINQVRVHTHLHNLICQSYEVLFHLPHTWTLDLLHVGWQRESDWVDDGEEKSQRWMNEVVFEGDINGEADSGRKKDPSSGAVTAHRLTAQFVCVICVSAHMYNLFCAWKKKKRRLLHLRASSISLRWTKLIAIRQR